MHFLYGLVSFAMTAMFYMAFTSPEWVNVVSAGLLGSGTMSSAVSAGVWAFLGLLFSITITLLIMHSHTRDNKGSKFIAYALIILLGITFNVFTETASTMDRVDERVMVKSEQSAVFKALAGSIKSSSGQSNQAYIKAQAEYADRLSTKNFRCNKRKKQDYDKKKCAMFTMQTAEEKIKMELFSKGAKSEKADTVELAQKASHNAEYAQMVVKIVMEQSGYSFVTSTAIISLFIIVTFEVLGVMIGGD